MNKKQLEIARSWMKKNAFLFIDNKTGEVNLTRLAEECANENNFYLDDIDFEIPEELFELAASFEEE